MSFWYLWRQLWSKMCLTKERTTHKWVIPFSVRNLQFCSFSWQGKQLTHSPFFSPSKCSTLSPFWQCHNKLSTFQARQALSSCSKGESVLHLLGEKKGEWVSSLPCQETAQDCWCLTEKGMSYLWVFFLSKAHFSCHFGPQQPPEVSKWHFRPQNSNSGFNFDKFL